ncbi:TPA: hypothetical protein ACRZ4F_005665 [Vibrio harveyi]
MTKKTVTSKNLTPYSKQVPVRWPFAMLDESRELSEKMGIQWSTFVKDAVQEKIDRERVNFPANNDN